MKGRPDPFPDTLTTGVWPRRAQVRAFGGRRLWPASSSKQMHAPVSAASLILQPRQLRGRQAARRTDQRRWTHIPLFLHLRAVRP